MNLRTFAAGLAHPGRLLHQPNDVRTRDEDKRQRRLERRQYKRLHQVPSREMVRRIDELRWSGASTPGMYGWDPTRNDRYTSRYEQMWGPPQP